MRDQRLRKLPLHLGHTMLTAACIQRVRSWGATTSTPATPSNSTSKTPGTVLELANMLRDPETRLRCPFGADWLDQVRGGSRLDRAHRIPFWLALMEMHGDGCRYGIKSDHHLPSVFDKLLESLTQSRLARQQALRGASEHMIGVPDDLERALVANPAFRDKIATHGFLMYALKDAPAYVAMITTEQLQRGDQHVSTASLMPPEAAKVIANALFDFALKNSLAHVMHEMSSEQVQVSAVFLSHLLL